MQYLLTEEEYQEYKKLKESTPELVEINKTRIRNAFTDIGQNIHRLAASYTHVYSLDTTRELCKPLWDELTKQGLI